MMASLFVIHGGEDQAFVEGRLMRPLPALGFDHRRSSVELETGGAKKSSVAAMMKDSAAIVASCPQQRGWRFCEQVAQARRAADP
jgi:hypothetical protein